MFTRAAATVLIVFASTAARAQEPMSTAEPPAETGLGAQQVMLGAVSSIFAAAGGVALGLSRKTTGYEVGAGLAATAVFPGLAVCALGSSSSWYDGSCAGPIVGAFLGR